MRTWNTQKNHCTNQQPATKYANKTNWNKNQTCKNKKKVVKCNKEEKQMPPTSRMDTLTVSMCFFFFHFFLLGRDYSHYLCFCVIYIWHRTLPHTHIIYIFLCGASPSSWLCSTDFVKIKIKQNRNIIKHVKS